MFENVHQPLCLICGLYSKDIQKQRHGLQASLKLANGYILPEGKMTPNTIFVGGIDTKVDENEIREFFTKYGPVKEVKIITYRGGICKGYAFVYFTEDVNIQTIVDQPAYFKGKKLKLGPAIMKDRSSRSIPSPSQWISPSQYVYCTCCPTAMTPPPSLYNGSGQYVQPYSYSNLPGVVIPQTSMNYTPTPYGYQQYPVPQWCGEQRMRVVNQVRDTRELCGLWGANRADSYVTSAVSMLHPGVMWDFSASPEAAVCHQPEA